MKQDLKQYVGQAVRTARKRRTGLTQADLAQAVNRTPESISNLERGYRLPSLETLLRIARFLNIPLPDLFSGYEPKRKVARERMELEIKLQDIGKALSPSGLKLAVAIVQTISRQEDGAA